MKEMSPYRTPDGMLTDRGKQRLWTFFWRTLMSLMGLAGTCGVWILVTSAKEIGHEFVANSPATIAATKAASDAASAAQEAKDAVAVAKSTADTANAKADQGLAIQGKIFEAIKQGHDDMETFKLTVTGSNATVVAEIQAVGARLDRIEKKQDQPK